LPEPVVEEGALAPVSKPRKADLGLREGPWLRADKADYAGTAVAGSPLAPSFLAGTGG
jgi:hypothetical protein